MSRQYIQALHVKGQLCSRRTCAWVVCSYVSSMLCHIFWRVSSPGPRTFRVCVAALFQIVFFCWCTVVRSTNKNVRSLPKDRQSRASSGVSPPRRPRQGGLAQKKSLCTAFVSRSVLSFGTQAFFFFFSRYQTQAEELKKQAVKGAACLACTCMACRGQVQAQGYTARHPFDRLEWSCCLLHAAPRISVT